MAGGCNACPEPKILPEAQPGVVAYLTVATQWEAGMGGRTGLRYGDCIVTLDRYLPQWQTDQPEVWEPISTPALMQDVQVIEHALLTAWGEQAPTNTPEKPDGTHH